jgi:glycosyltransferase involved in cell wall biosynthesis
VHDLESQHPGENKSEGLLRALAKMDERALRGARGIASLTETFRREVMARGWQPGERVFVIPDAYDETIYFPRARDGSRAALGLPPDAPIAAYAGLTLKYRGVDVLLRAFQAWKEPQAMLVIVGGRDFELTELKTLAEELRLGERVRFAGRQPQTLVAQYLAAADVLVIPDTVTDTTASPLKMFEYMAMARPIVCVDRESLREIMGDSAIYFRRGDEGALAGALARALSPEARAMGEGARARVAEYTYARRAEKIIRAAETILAANGA